jgi:hypothetical protein
MSRNLTDFLWVAPTKFVSRKLSLPANLVEIDGDVELAEWMSCGQGIATRVTKHNMFAMNPKAHLSPGCFVVLAKIAPDLAKLVQLDSMLPAEQREGA